jgi:hypothetical protein
MNLTDEFLKLPFVIDGRKTLPRHPTKKWGKRAIKDIQGVVLHQSLEERASASGNAKYHSGPNHISPDGLPGLSYTGFMEKTGKLYLANDFEDATWSQGTEIIPGDENHRYVAFCVGGNFSGPGYKGTQEPTEAQRTNVLTMWAFLKVFLGLRNNQLFGHYSFGKPACPGYQLMMTIDVIHEQRDWVGGFYNFETIDGRQKALESLGFMKVQEGQFGVWDLESKGALVAFQRAHGLVADGVWGLKTEAAITDAVRGNRHES